MPFPVMAGTIPPLLVLGLGNDVLGDDAAGLHVAAAVHRRLADVSRVEVRQTTEMGLALLDEIVDREGVIVVDAVHTGTNPPGTVRVSRPDAGDAPLRAPAPHFLGLPETLALGRVLGLRMPREVRLVSIEVLDPFTLGTALTPPVQAALPRAVACVVREALAFVRAATLPAPAATAQERRDGGVG